MDNRGQAADDSMMVYIAAMILTVVAGAAVISLAVDRPVVAVALFTLGMLVFGLWLSHRAGRRVGAWASQHWGGSDG